MAITDEMLDEMIGTAKTQDDNFENPKHID